MLTACFFLSQTALAMEYGDYEPNDDDSYEEETTTPKNSYNDDRKDDRKNKRQKCSTKPSKTFTKKEEEIIENICIFCVDKLETTKQGYIRFSKRGRESVNNKFKGKARLAVINSGIEKGKAFYKEKQRIIEKVKALEEANDIFLMHSIEKASAELLDAENSLGDYKELALWEANVKKAKDTVKDLDEKWNAHVELIRRLKKLLAQNNIDAVTELLPK